MGYKLTYQTTDIWAASFALAYNIPLLTTTLDAMTGKVVWHLDNADDRAWKTCMDFRCGGERALVDAQALRSAHRYLARQANLARTGASHDHPTD